MKQFAGNYEVMGMTVTVSLRGDKLFAAIPGQGESSLELIDGSQYRVASTPQITIDFKVGATGEVREAAINYGGMALTAKRRP